LGIKLKLSGKVEADLKLHQKTLPVSRFSKRHLYNVQGKAKGIILELLGHVCCGMVD